MKTNPNAIANQIILLHQKWKKFSELNIKVELKMSFLVAKKNALIELYI